VGCLYGHGGRNFPSTIVRRLRGGETIRADRDRLASPTWVREVVAVSATLAATTHFGLYHCTAQGETTWADFARLAARLVGAPEERVQSVAYAELPLKAQRPRRAILDNRALRALGLAGRAARVRRRGDRRVGAGQGRAAGRGYSTGRVAANRAPYWRS